MMQTAEQNIFRSKQYKLMCAVPSKSGWFVDRLIRLFVAVCLVFIFLTKAFSLPAQAIDSVDVAGNWVGNPAISEVRLVSAVTGAGNLDRLPLGLEFRLAPGWKIYWRTPGEAGLPPSLTLSLADGRRIVAEISWPVPKRFDAFGFDNFGYAEWVILPVVVTGHVPGMAQQIRGRVEALVCKDICVPLAEDIGLDLADGPAKPSSLARDIAKFSALVPRLGAASSISEPKVALDGTRLLFRFAPGGPKIDEIFVEGIDGLAFKKPVFSDDIARIDMVGTSSSLAGRNLDLTIIAGTEFRTARVRVDDDDVNLVKAPSRPVGTVFRQSIWFVMGLAFLGGLILNLMPCVLPVLAIKLASIVDASGLQRRFVRMRFVSGAAGIMTSFGLLAAGLAALRHAGGQVGWGVQFQSPLFLSLIMLVVGLFMLMMLDRLFLPVPAFAQSTLRGLNNTANRTSLWGDFMAGILATMLATPCSAPFVGSAVTAALTGSTAQLFVIFIAMGLGLAAPWLMVAVAPEVVARLPRPGKWMLWLKRGLAGLLLATIVWLGFLLYAVQGAHASMLSIAAITVVLVGVAAGRKMLIAVGSGVLVVALVMLPVSSKNTIKDLAGGTYWQTWSKGATIRALAANKLVLVDVTADWCITCKANKTLVLEGEPVSDILRTLEQNADLVLLQADWTRPDETISSFLASHNRFGIPFNIIYGPNAPDGIVLGELLTAEMVLDGLTRAGMAAQGVTR
jgi:suppressor for copper-sensitivity B